MALSLAQIREKLLEQQNSKDRARTGGGGGDKANYPFWSNPDGSTATLRYLPDGDTSNDFFWVERLIIRLPFPSIKGQASTGRPIEVQVPCVDMWKPGSCPINAEIRPWWKGGKEMEDMARKYWRKKSFLFQGFVTQNPNPEDLANLPENPIRRFVINPSVFDRIKTVFLDQEIENNPIDYDNGLDFRLVKGSKGGYADYGTSSWARRERALSDDERSAIDQYGLFTLSNYLPKRPDEAHMQAIMDMFHDSVDEKPYDPDKYAQFYKPFGLQTDNDSGSSMARDVAGAEKRFSKPATTPRNISVTAPTASADVADAPFDGAKAVSSTTASVAESGEAKKMTSPEDILAALRRRQQAKA